MSVSQLGLGSLHLSINIFDDIPSIIEWDEVEVEEEKEVLFEPAPIPVIAPLEEKDV